MKQYRRQKVLFVTFSDAIGGAERLAVTLAHEFKSRDWRVQAVFAHTPNSAALLAWCRTQGVEAEASPAVIFPFEPHSLRDALDLRNLIRRSNPDVVNLHYGGTHIPLRDVLAARLAGRCRVVVTVHNPITWDAGMERKRRMTGFSARLAHEVIAISRATRGALLAAGVPARKIAVVPDGVRTPATKPGRAEARARLGLPPHAFMVGCLARLVASKGIDDLIEGAAKVPDPDGALRVVIAGDGPERSALEELAASRLGPRAIFLGRVPDTDDFYSAIDVFALPSHSEGFGLVYVEAAFHGIPSIGTAIEAIPETIADGETGLLVPDRDPKAVTAAIKRFWDDPAWRQQLGTAAQARACTDFTVERMVDGYAHVFGINSRPAHFQVQSRSDTVRILGVPVPRWW